MCCLLILCREETTKGAEDPNKVPRSTKERTKGWHDKRMRNEYNLGDKMFMNSSSKESFKHEEKNTTVIYLRHMVSSRSTDEGNILR
jgi:hypothetical protein